MIIANDYDSFINCTDNQNEDNNIVVNFLILSISRSILLLYFILLKFGTNPNFLSRVKDNDKIVIPKRPNSRFIIPDLVNVNLDLSNKIYLFF